MSSSDIWMIGDVQGCCGPLDALLEQPELTADPAARYWFAGDLINRGPQSLAALRRIRDMEERSVSILGNHDLHLLAAAAGVRRPSKNDTIDEILNAPDANELIDWLRFRPLAHFEYDHLMVHAGVLAKWDVAKTLSLAGEVQEALRSANWQKRLQKMYGNEPVHWKDEFEGAKRLRVIINALTRMRLCTAKGLMDFSAKALPGDPPPGLMPWFDVPKRATRDVTVVFGHWSTLGLLLREDVICLDSGCVWGGQLTAVRLQNRHVVQVKCSQFQDPGKD